VKRLLELRICPFADARHRIGCDVDGVQRAERRVELQTASVRFGLVTRVAGHAIGGACQILAARDKSGIVLDILCAREWNSQQGCGKLA
jgi:hypothetical protein